MLVFPLEIFYLIEEPNMALLMFKNVSNRLHITQLKDQMLYVFVYMFVKDNALPHWDVLFPYTVCNCNCNLSQNHVSSFERHKLYCLNADI